LEELELPHLELKSDHYDEEDPLGEPTKWRKQSFTTQTPPQNRPEVSPLKPAHYWSAFLRYVRDLFWWWFPVLHLVGICMRWGARYRPVQLSCEDVLVREDMWEMLEPEEGKVKAEKQYREASAVLAALRLDRRQALFPEENDEHAEKIFAGYLQEANHTLTLASGKHTDSALDGTRYVRKDTSSVLEQLSERKWTRLNAPLFLRIAFFRLVVVLLTGAFLVRRVSVASSVSDPASSASHGKPLYPCGPLSAVYVNIYIFVAFMGIFFTIHFLRFLVLGAPSLLYYLFCRRACIRCRARWTRPNNNKVPHPLFYETREQALYVSAHSGRLGKFHTVTLLSGSLLLLLGGLQDLHGQGSFFNAPLTLYQSGIFLLSLHLFYFLAGWEYTGPLLVSVFSVVTSEFVRWLWLFIPLGLCLAFPLFLAAPGATPDVYGHLFTLIVDQTHNPFPEKAFLSEVGEGLGKYSKVIAILVWAISFVMLATVLMSLLIAQFTRVFDSQHSRGVDFLIERVRMNMMVETMQSGTERFHVSNRNRYWLLNRCIDAQKDRAENATLSKTLALRPYFFFLQAAQPAPSSSRSSHSGTGSTAKPQAKAAERSNHLGSIMRMDSFASSGGGHFRHM
jgi:hypothetical protein